MTALARNEAERWTADARAAGHGEIDVVTTLATFVPLRIVTDYLGVPFHETGQPSQMPGFHGGDSFPLADSLQSVFAFTKIQHGIVPTAADLFTWIKDAFRNSFNNFDPTKPLFATFREPRPGSDRVPHRVRPRVDRRPQGAAPTWRRGA